MSIVYTADVFCDDCGDWIHGATGSKLPTKTEVRAIVSKKKWKRKGHNDICPRCAAAELSKSAGEKNV